MNRRVILAIAAAAAWGSTAVWAPAHAAPIQLPPLPLPPVPAPVVPVLEMLAPVASPQCGNAIFAAVLLRTELGAVPGGLPIEPTPILGPLFIVCGTIGVAPNRLSCTPDVAAKGVLDEITRSAAGLPTPADTRVAGPAVEELIILQDALPPPASTAGLAGTVSGALVCTPVSPASAPLPAPPPEPSDDAAPTPEPDTFTSSVLGDTVPGATPLFGALTPSPAPAPPPRAASPTPAGTVSDVRTGGFRYPAIFVLPIVGVAIFGSLARGLTRPVRA